MGTRGFFKGGVNKVIGILDLILYVFMIRKGKVGFRYFVVK